MKYSWDIEKLRELIKGVQGEQQLALAKPHLDSVVWKLRAINHHLRVASSTVEEVTEKINSVTNPIVYMWDIDDKGGADEVEEQRLKVQANLIACAQCLHSISDLMAHLIIDCLNIEMPNGEHVNLKGVQRELPVCNLKSKAVSLLGDKKYLYFQDFVNTVKHISLIPSETNINIENKPYKYQFKFRDFTYKGREHGELSIKEFMETMNKLGVLYIALGDSINHLLDES